MKIFNNQSAPSVLANFMDNDELFGKEHAEFEEALREQRYNEQKQNKDYDYDHEGNIEKCDCGMSLNSHGHCPRCDY